MSHDLHDPVKDAEQMPSSSWREIIQDLIAGTIGGMAGIATGQPLDTVKVRIQQDVHGTQYKGALDCARKMAQKEGILSLYKGLYPPLMGNAPMNATVFVSYGASMRWLESNLPNPEKSGPNYTNLFIAGSAAGFAQSIVATPVELTKCQLQRPGADYKGGVDCVRRTVQVGGITGLFRGFAATTWRDSPSYGLYFASYEWVKYKLLPNDEPNAQSSVVDMLIAGGVAGLAAWGSTYPFDIAKSIIQTTPENKVAPTLRHVFKSNYAESGAQFFLRGLTPTLIRAVPVNAVTLLVYEKFVEIMSAASEQPQN